MKFDFSILFSPRVLVGAMAIALLALAVTCIGLELSMSSLISGDIRALMTVIPAPSGTPLPTFTPTIDPHAPTPTPTPAPGQITIGSYIQIKGTEGQGLRIRSAPGLNGNPLFMGFDAEVFVVNDGPRQADGYTWYYLVAPYDTTRAGWAASDFFSMIPPPEDTETP